MSSYEIELKDIKSGDYVSTRYRDESRQEHAGSVTTKQETKERPIVARPPKVFFVDQHGNEIILLQDLRLK